MMLSHVAVKIIYSVALSAQDVDCKTSGRWPGSDLEMGEKIDFLITFPKPQGFAAVRLSYWSMFFAKKMVPPHWNFFPDNVLPFLSFCNWIPFVRLGPRKTVLQFFGQWFDKKIWIHTLIFWRKLIFCKKVYFSFIFKYDCKLPLSILILENLRVSSMRFMRFLSMLEKEETLASELDPHYVSLSSWSANTMLDF